jgi:hypothetical protein
MPVEALNIVILDRRRHRTRFHFHHGPGCFDEFTTIIIAASSIWGAASQTSIVQLSYFTSTR